MTTTTPTAISAPPTMDQSTAASGTTKPAETASAHTNIITTHIPAWVFLSQCGYSHSSVSC